MKDSISLDSADALYLCTWNSNEIKQIHTKNTLWNEYKDTNLFDDALFETFFNDNLDDYKIKDYLKFSQLQGIFLNVTFVCDNMTITRIA